jgi:phenylpyruvate tautomerase PptA (4-oxalocrotonate tautomerase family)
MRRPHPSLPALALAATLVSGVVQAQGFSFSQQDDAERKAEAARSARIAEQLSTPCRADLLNKKIMVVIGEVQSDGYIVAQQQNYGPHFEAINARLRSLGLKTFTPEEIRRQIAQAEIDAYFRNDPDAALAASKRLGASFVLRGLITATGTRSMVMAVNQVTVTMDFNLAGSDGRQVATARADSASYAGSDVRRMALTLVDEKADEVVASLYADYCRKAGLAAGGPSRK